MTEITDKKQKTWLYQKGQSGNPLGRPKGSFSIKTKLLKKLEKNPELLDGMIDELIKNQPGLVWQMIDGRPPQSQAPDNKEPLIISLVRYNQEDVRP